MIINIAPWRMVKLVYDRCKPVGMGMLQFVPGDMAMADAMKLVASQMRPGETQYITMDYVMGRQCKFTFNIIADEQVEFDENDWYDHTKEELEALIKAARETEACMAAIKEHFPVCREYLVAGFNADKVGHSVAAVTHVSEEAWNELLVVVSLGIPLEGYTENAFNTLIFGLCDLYTSVENPQEMYPSILPLLKEVCEQAYVELSTGVY